MRTNSSRPRLPGSRKSRGRWKTGWSRNRSTTAISRPAWMMLAISCGIGGSTPRPESGHEPRERRAQIRTARWHSPGRCRRVEPPGNRASLPPPASPATSTFPRPRTNRSLRLGPSPSSLRVPLRGGQSSPMIPPAPHPRTTNCTGNRSRPQPILGHHPGNKASPNRRAGVRLGEKFVDHPSFDGRGSVSTVCTAVGCDGTDGDDTIPPGRPRNRSEGQQA